MAPNMMFRGISIRVREFCLSATRRSRSGAEHLTRSGGEGRWEERCGKGGGIISPPRHHIISLASRTKSYQTAEIALAQRRGALWPVHGARGMDVMLLLVAQVTTMSRRGRPPPEPTGPPPIRADGAAPHPSRRGRPPPEPTGPPPTRADGVAPHPSRRGRPPPEQKGSPPSCVQGVLHARHRQNVHRVVCPPCP